MILTQVDDLPIVAAPFMVRAKRLIARWLGIVEPPPRVLPPRAVSVFYDFGLCRYVKRGMVPDEARQMMEDAVYDMKVIMQHGKAIRGYTWPDERCAHERDQKLVREILNYGEPER